MATVELPHYELYVGGGDVPAANGGFYDSGPLGQPADRRDKVWWVQAEALVSALTMYRLTADPKYAQVYLKTWAFINTKQTDWSTG